MKLIKKLKDRYTILTIILVSLMGVLVFQLSVLTIAKGDEYREKSDNTRLKEIYTTAARGEIRDRYGRILAGSRPSFSVQILKDELSKDQEIKNSTILRLIRLLEEDGVEYTNDFPIDLMVFDYVSEDDFFAEDLLPQEKAIDLLLESGLLGDFILSGYTYPEYKDHYDYRVGERLLQALRSKDIDIPIETSYDDGFSFVFIEDRDVEAWKEANNISKNYDAYHALMELVSRDRVAIRKTMNHPLSRVLAYELLKANGLEGNLKLEDYSITYKQEYLAQKKNLMSRYPMVTRTSSGEEDFVNIFKEVSLKNFLKGTYVRKNDKGKEENLWPGKILLDRVKELDPSIPISYDITGEDQVNFNYLGRESAYSTDPIDILIEYGEKHGLIEGLILDDDIKWKAQEQLLKDGVNPRISISEDLDYVSRINIKKLYEENKLDPESGPEELFDKIKEKYKLDEELSPYESLAVMNIYIQLAKQGYKAYEPMDIAYGIKDATVAKIEESMADYNGIKVSIELVRYYPEGETAAHILGYLGKISKKEEIEKYVDDQGYSVRDIIGKTGVEESYEHMLKGENGIKKVEVDAYGNTRTVISEKKPKPGNNVYLTIDLRLQQAAEEALKKTLEKIQVAGTYTSEWGDFKFDINKSKGRPYRYATSGAVVALDVKTGEVLAMASYPAYDPNLFSTGISSDDWNSLFPEDDRDPLAPRPLYNIATQTSVQPGSTFKMITALAALDKGLSPYKTIRDMGIIEIGTEPFRCWAWNQGRWTHGYVNVYEALRDSCNYYFYSLALGYNQKTGENVGVKVEIEDIVNLSKAFGLNDKTGIEINIPAEVHGGVPNPERKILESKNSLNRALRTKLDKYQMEGENFTKAEIEEKIEEIVSWLEYDEPMTRGEVVRRLREMGLEPEKKLPGDRDGLADLIKYTYLNYAGWDITDTLNTTIGQGQGSYTPIQMANYIATIANGGYRNELTLIDNVKNYNNSELIEGKKSVRERVDLKDYSNLDHIKKGMLMVSSDGSARRVFGNFPVNVASKTGTAQKAGTNPVNGEKFDDFAWFVAFAPYEEPEIAIASVIFQGGSGGYAAPMTRDIIAEYLRLQEEDTKDALPFNSSLVE